MAHPSIVGGKNTFSDDEAAFNGFDRRQQLIDLYNELIALVSSGPGIYARAVQFGALQVEPFKLATDAFHSRIPAIQKSRVHGLRVTFDDIEQQNERLGILITPIGNAWQTGFAVRAVQQNQDGTYRRLSESEEKVANSVLGLFSISGIEELAA